MVKIGSTICFLLFISTNAFSANPEKAELVHRMYEEKDNYKSKDEQERKVLKKLYDVEKRIKRLAKKRSINSNKVMGAEGHVKKVARQIVGLKAIIKGKRAQLGSRLKAMYMFQNLGALRVLLSSKMGDVDKNIKYLKNISQRDVQLISSYLVDLKSLKGKQKLLKEKVKTLVASQNRLKHSENNLTKEQKNKKHILLQVKRSKIKSEKHLLSMKSKLKKTYNAEMGDLKIYTESFFEKKGQLNWPIRGRLRDKYGLVYNYKFNYRLKRNGVFILPDQVESVHSVFTGKVSYVGDVEGYGMSVIIEHGDNYFTVYSHLSNIVVNAGQDIQTGDVISENLESTNDKALYFEVRHFSESVDPEKWLGKQVIVGKAPVKNIQM